MTTNKTLAEITGLSQDFFRQMISKGHLHLDAQDEPRTTRIRYLTTSDALRACVMVALARAGISYADGGKLTAPLGWKGGRFIYRSTTCADPETVLAIWAEEAEGPEDSDRKPNQPHVRFQAALMPASSAANLLARPTVDALVTVPLWRHFDRLAAVAETRRAKARTPEQNGWAAVMEKRKP
jgi:hypothetical protein